MKTAFRIVLFLVTGAALALPLPQTVVERWYSGLLYPPLQRALTGASNLVPFALLDVLLVALTAIWVAGLVRDFRQRSTGWVLARWSFRTAAAGAALYLAFLLAWGLNYRRVPLEHKLRYEAAAVTPDAARRAADRAASRLNALYADAHTAGFGSAGGVDPDLAQAFARATRQLGAPGTTRPGRPKHSLLDLYFRPAAVAGMTDPFFLETLVERDLLPVERPFVVAHEWSHLAGFADEGEANFSGWLTCMHAGTSSQYSGWLFLFGELADALSRTARAEAVARLADGPRADLRAIAARLARDVQPRVSAAGWRVYDQYLKANRIEAGAASYAQVVRLVLGTGVGLTAIGSESPAR